MKLITTIAILLLTSAAFATGGQEPPDDPSQEQRQDQDQYQDQYQGQEQGQGQHQEANSTSSSQQDQANQQNVTFTQPDDITIRNVPSLSSPNAYPTSPCRIAVSGGLVFAGGGASAGGSIEDPGCTLREDARTFSELGVPAMGLYLMCNQAESVTGQRDKKGKAEKHQPVTPMGSAECLRMVKKFQDDTSGVGALRKENDTLRHDKMALVDEFEQYKANCNEAKNRITEVCRK